MRSIRFDVLSLSIAMFVFGAAAAFGQTFPTKPLRIITSAPGGTSDFTSRLIARGLTESLGQQVIVDNRGNFGGEVIARAQPDGYTMMLDGPSLWLIPLLQRSPYDPLRDFSPVSLAVKAPNVLIVSPSLPAGSVKELIALAKARPGQLNYATGGIGNSSHLVGELFKSATGVNIVGVHYKGTGPGLNALVAGEVQIMFANATIAIPQIKAGKVKALAVASLQPSLLLPDVPTLAASALPIEATIVQGIVAPARTPAVLVNRLSQEIARVLNRPEVKERHFSIGVETVGSSPEELAAVIKSDIVKWGKVIKDLGIRAD
jgi:tripartite-type tricarboxylate transporter receptor subunit TctC